MSNLLLEHVLSIAHEPSQELDQPENNDFYGGLEHLFPDCEELVFYKMSAEEIALWNEPDKSLPFSYRPGYCFAPVESVKPVPVSHNLRTGVYVQLPSFWPAEVYLRTYSYLVLSELKGTPNKNLIPAVMMGVNFWLNNIEGERWGCSRTWMQNQVWNERGVDPCNSNKPFKDTYEKIATILAPLFEPCRHSCNIRHISKGFICKANPEFESIRKIYTKHFTSEEIGENCILVGCGKQYKLSARKQLDRNKKVFQENEVNHAQDLKIMRLLSPQMEDYRMLANYLTQANQKTISRLFSDSRIEEAKQAGVKDLTEKASKRKWSDETLSMYSANLGYRLAQLKTETNYYRITKDLNCRIFDTLLQNLTGDVSKALFKSCIEFDFSSSQLFIINQLYPRDVFQTYLDEDAMWDVLVDDLSNIAKREYTKGQLKSAIFTLLFGGSWDTITDDYASDTISVSEAKVLVRGLKKHPLYKELTIVSKQFSKDLIKKGSVTFGNRTYELKDFSKDSGSSKAAIGSQARSAKAHILQHLESMSMYGELGALLDYNEKQTHNQLIAALCVVKHDGLVAKCGSRLVVGGKACNLLLAALQEGANAQARKWGLSSAPTIKAKLIN